MITRKGACAIAFAAVVALPAAAQTSSPSTAALGMGDNYTAAARGFSSLAWNPANLGLSGNPGSSFQFATVRGLVGLDPVTLTDIAQQGGKVVPLNIKESWQGQIEAEGSQAGTSGFDGNWLALQIGRIGIQANTSARAIANLSPGVTRLVMFGNTNASGTPQTISLSNSAIDVVAYSTVAVGYAQPFMMSDGKSRLSVGVTGKYTMGHFMVEGNESTGAATASPLAVTLKFPTIATIEDKDQGGKFGVNNGSGIGIDVGAAFESGAWTFGAAVQNVMNSFKFDEDKLFFRAGSLEFTKDTSSSSFDSEPLTTARARSGAGAVPTALLTKVDNMKFKPVIAAGAAYKMSQKMRVTGDVRLGSDEGIQTSPKTHAGAGIEYRLMSWLPLRVGAAYLKMGDNNTGSQLGGGLGIDLGGFNLAASAQRRVTDLGHDTIVMVTLFSHGM